MAVYFARRLLLLPPVIVAATLLMFLIMQVLPGDVVFTILADSTHSEAMRDALRSELGLDRPWYEQYAAWLSRSLTGEAVSMDTGEPINAILRRQLPVTLLLALYTTVLSVIVSIPLAVVAATKRGRWPDFAIRSLTLAGLSVPAVFSALLVLFLLLRIFRWSPPIIYAGPFEDLRSHLEIMWPAVLILAWEYSSQLVRITRSSVIETLEKEYVIAAVARGNRRLVVVIKYGLENALLPPITAVGLQFGSLLGGALVLETVFGLPGIGRGIVQAAVARDVPLVLSDAAVLVGLYLLLNLIVDALYFALDRRIDPGKVS